MVGFIDDFGARAWMGVPFAAPPVGELRWRAPQPPARSAAVTETLAAGPMCPQFASILSGDDLGAEPAVAGNEDCLYLNIWSPPNARDLPVMVWIHGGGNTIGHAGSFIGARLATAHDLVVVTTNYRLGVFGWFNHPALQTGDPADDSGNYGTLDLVRALEWTRDNIAAFGGDPGRVTVFGESAGAYNTLAMMASPLAAGLFHRAVVQSGGFEATDPVRGRNYSDDGGHDFSAPEIVDRLLIADGIAANGRGAREHQQAWDSAEAREYLYGKSPGEIFAALDGGAFGMIDLPDNFGDGHVLPNLPTADIFSNAGNHNQVPVILGVNRDEPTLFMTRDPRYVDNILGIFYSLKDEQTYRSLAHYGGRAWKVRGVDELARAMTASGNPHVYAYRFDWDEEPSIMGYDLSVALGAAHALEIGFVFGEFNGLGLGYVYPDDENQWRLSNSMMSYWAEFAYTGDPGSGRGATETPWLAWGQERPDPDHSRHARRRRHPHGRRDADLRDVEGGVDRRCGLRRQVRALRHLRAHLPGYGPVRRRRVRGARLQRLAAREHLPVLKGAGPAGPAYRRAWLITGLQSSAPANMQAAANQPFAAKPPDASLMKPPAKGATAPAIMMNAGWEAASPPDGSNRASTPSMIGITAVGRAANTGVAMKNAGTVPTLDSDTPVTSRIATMTAIGSPGAMRLPTQPATSGQAMPTSAPAIRT